MSVRLDKRKKLKSKAYRSAYMQGHVRTGIAYQIRALREQRGLTQTDLADLVGTKQSVISRLESTEYGKVAVQTLLDVATALDVALTVRFSSYPDFMRTTDDVSPKALEVDSFDDSCWDVPVEPAALGVVVSDSATEIPTQISATGVVPAVVPPQPSRSGGVRRKKA